uniref:Uncharacterized protein n=1 Tax=Anguilla anguilla TaxID=7936 RepID=A0A0E9UUY4_ANGAN
MLAKIVGVQHPGCMDPQIILAKTIQILCNTGRLLGPLKKCYLALSTSSARAPKRNSWVVLQVKKSFHLQK